MIENGTGADGNVLNAIMNDSFEPAAESCWDLNMFSRFDDIPIRLIASYSMLRLFSIASQ